MSLAPLIMEKLSVHNLNKPPFCSLSILNMFPASSVLQLAATQHLFIAAGYVSETLIEQQEFLIQTGSVSKRTRVPQMLSGLQPTGPALEMAFSSMYSKCCYSTCISPGKC